MLSIKKLSVMLILSCCVSANAASISEIDQRIYTIRQSLEQAKNQQSDIEQYLQETETGIGNFEISLKTLNQQLRKHQRELYTLGQKQHQYENQLKNQQVVLTEQMHAFYILQNHNYLQTLLNQTDAKKISRHTTYFKYFNASRLKAMDDIQKTLDSLSANEINIKGQAAALEKLRKDKLTEQAQIIKLQETRQQVLEKLKSNINTKEQQLAELSQNKLHLQHLVNQLQNEPHTPVQTPLAFADMQGKLRWPTKGHIAHRFGQTINGSELTSNGTLLIAPKGQNVYAIYPGKVIFSGWLKGFGLLMIIDHGDGYLSLYGRDNSLYKKVGDFVNARDLIATVGDSGGFDQSGLYFEIRHYDEPLNPQNWCG